MIIYFEQIFGGILLIIKCKKCGNEHELESNKRLSEFECECGGEFTRISNTNL
jgi:hypothetical protein